MHWTGEQRCLYASLPDLSWRQPVICTLYGKVADQGKLEGLCGGIPVFFLGREQLSQ
jgi:hypothetical protein